MINNSPLEIALADIDPATDLDEKVVSGLVESYSATTIQIAPIILRPAEKEGRFVVVSGRHRAEAAVRSGWRAIAAVVIPFATEDDRLRAELIGLDENNVRRDLTPAERALDARRRVEILESLGRIAKRGGDRKSAAAKAKSNLQNDSLIGAGAAVAAAHGRSEATAGRSLRRGSLPRETLERVKQHPHLNVGKELDALVDLPPEAREEVLAAADAGKTTKATTRLQQQQRDLRELALKGKQASLPPGKYGVILADPPWRWSPWGEEGMAKAVENTYPTMTLDDVKALPVASIAHDDSVLFLWIRNDMIEEAIDVVRAWGFRCKSSIIWRKPRLGTGYHVRTCHEQLLLCTRGNPPGCPPGRQVASVVDAPVGRHSEKPEEFYRIIESYYPALTKVELFQRDKGEGARPGWAVWGNESSSTLPAGEGRGGGDRAPAEPGPDAQPSQTAPPIAEVGQPQPENPAPDAAPPDRPLPVARAISPAEREDLIRRGVIQPVAAAAPEGVKAGEEREPPKFVNPYSRGPDIAKPRLPA